MTHSCPTSVHLRRKHSWIYTLNWHKNELIIVGLWSDPFRLVFVTFPLSPWRHPVVITSTPSQFNSVTHLLIQISSNILVKQIYRRAVRLQSPARRTYFSFCSTTFSFPLCLAFDTALPAYFHCCVVLQASQTPSSFICIPCDRVFSLVITLVLIQDTRQLCKSVFSSLNGGHVHSLICGHVCFKNLSPSDICGYSHCG